MEENVSYIDDITRNVKITDLSDEFFLKSVKGRKSLKILELEKFKNPEKVIDEFNNSLKEYEKCKCLKNLKPDLSNFLFLSKTPLDLKTNEKKEDSFLQSKKNTEENILMEKNFINEDKRTFDSDFYINILDYMFENNFNKVMTILVINYLEFFNDKEKAKNFMINNLKDEKTQKVLFDKISDINEKLIENNLIVKMKNKSEKNIKDFLMVFVYYFKHLEDFFI